MVMVMVLVLATAWMRTPGALDFDGRPNCSVLSNNLIIIICLGGTPVLVAMGMTTQVLF